MKTAISVPDEVFEQVDIAAKRLGVSRSEIFTKAVRQFLMKSRGAEITASYNAAFAQDAPGSEEDRFRRAATRTALLDVEWEEA